MEKQPKAPIEYYQQLLRDSEAGQALSENPPRFSSWHWDDHQRMKLFFGADLDNLEHGAYQAEFIAVPFIRAQEGDYQAFTYDEATTLVVTNVFHDAHEGITGDLPAPEKDADWLRYELQINEQVVMPILRDKGLLDKLHNVMGDLDGLTFVGRGFKAIEICGYFLTGLRAWELSKSPWLDDTERELCADMAKIVCLHDWPLIKKFATEFAYCQYLNDTYSSAIAEMRR